MFLSSSAGLCSQGVCRVIILSSIVNQPSCTSVMSLHLTVHAYLGRPLEVG